MILCHKDGGLLSAEETEDTTGLYGCGCISGYVRGFEPNLDRPAAIQKQVAETKDWISLFVGQKRDEPEIAPLRRRLARLEALK